MARKALFIVLILSLMAVPALAKQTVSASKAKAPAAAGQTSRIFSDFGGRWNSMSDKERQSFMEGYYSAIQLICTNAALGDSAQANQGPDQQNKQFLACMGTYAPFELAPTKAAMTELYQDSANNHIPFSQMIGFAFAKVAGKLDEGNLAQLRQNVEAQLKGGK